VLIASIALRHIPQAWSRVRVVFIPKPGRNGHILAKDFRPIIIPVIHIKNIGKIG